MSGELIGINSAKLSDTDVEGMGYAIPIDRVSKEIKTMLEGNNINSSSSTTNNSNSSLNSPNENTDNGSIFDLFSVFGL